MTTRPCCPAGGSITVVLMLLYPFTASAQPTFSLDYQAPPKGAMGACFPFPITEGDILVPPTPGMLPGFIPAPLFPCINISVGFGPFVPGLGLPAAPGAAGLPPGIPGLVEVDALSYGNDFPVLPGLPPASVLWVFSVDEWAVGNPGMPLPPNVATMSPPLGLPTTVAAAIFHDITLDSGPTCDLLAPPGGNTLLLDGNGDGLPSPVIPGVGLPEPTIALPGVPDLGANLDAVDIDFIPIPPGIPITVYFSLDSGPAVLDVLEALPGSGSAVANAMVSGANVLVAGPPFPGPVIWAPAFLLGLDLAGIDTDDLDALILWENGSGVFEPPPMPFAWVGGLSDMLFFSVRRGSAVIGVPSSGPGGCVGLPISEGDILWPPAAPGLPPRIWITAEQLGLATMRSGFLMNDDLDALDVTADCNGNFLVDSIETGLGTTPDCNGNRVPDACDIASGFASDCNANGIPDSCDIASGFASDCNANGLPDSCDIASGFASDCNANGLIDLCETHPLTFAAPAFYPGTITAEHILAVDLNADTLPDLAYTSPGGGYVGVRLNTGGGTFSTETLTPSGSFYFNGLAAADLDADGDNDLAVANSGLGGGVVVLLNTGSGGFPVSAGPFPGAGPAAYRLAAADLDADGDMDLAAVNTATPSLTVYLNTTVGGVLSFATFTLPTGVIPLDVRVGLLNADALPDLAVTNRGSDTLGIYLNTGGGAFAAPSFYPAGPGPFGMALADTDADGDLDVHLAQIDSNTSAVMMNTGAGAFGTPTSYASLGQDPRAADLDADGDPDLIGVPVGNVSLRALRNTGGGSFPGFGLSINTGGFAVDRLALADLNGDSFPDVAVGASGGLSILLAVFSPLAPDCNNNLIPDACDIASGFASDCNANGIPDSCDIASGTSTDADGNGVPDECEPCDADVNCDGSANGVDVEIQELAVGGDLADYCLPDADFNQDGAVNGGDVEAIELVVGGGPCP